MCLKSWAYSLATICLMGAVAVADEYRTYRAEAGRYGNEHRSYYQQPDEGSPSDAPKGPEAGDHGCCQPKCCEPPCCCQKCGKKDGCKKECCDCCNECCDCEDEDECNGAAGPLGAGGGGAAANCSWLNHLPLLEDFGIYGYGWVAQGVTFGGHQPTNPAQGSGNLPVVFNYRDDNYQLNQLYLVLQRDVSGDGLDIGGRADILYGTDYFFTTALGLETHKDGTQHWNDNDGNGINGTSTLGWAMPQLYLEAAYGDISVKLGHWYTPMGYEVVVATGQFFYSHAYTHQYGEPFTHTGAIATIPLTDLVSIQSGFTRGWDNWEDTNDDLGYIGGVTVKLFDELVNIAWVVHVGDEDPAGINTRYFQTMVAQFQLLDWLQYVFETDYGFEDDAGVGGTHDAEWYGVNQYLFCNLADGWDLGLRLEWFRDDDAARVSGAFGGAVPAVGPGNWYQLTGGLHWAPYECLLFRPEVRYDWFDGDTNAAGPFNDGTRSSQFTCGLDCIWRF